MKQNHNLPAAFQRAARSVKSRAAAGLGALGLAAASTGALASTTVGATAAAGIDGATSEVQLVQTAMIGVLILLVVFALIRRSFGK